MAAFFPRNLTECSILQKTQQLKLYKSLNSLTIDGFSFVLIEILDNFRNAMGFFFVFEIIISFELRCQIMPIAFHWKYKLERYRLQR